MDNEATHIGSIRNAIMRTLALYAAVNDDVQDSQMVAALAACLCDALIIKGAQFSDELVDSIRKTYEVCEIQRAMDEREENSVQ